MLPLAWHKPVWRFPAADLPEGFSSTRSWIPALMTDNSHGPECLGARRTYWCLDARALLDALDQP
jgi:hypothetical protein